MSVVPTKCAKPFQRSIHDILPAAFNDSRVLSASYRGWNNLFQPVFGTTCPQTWSHGSFRITHQDG
jgi:hypothetical protein